jgi:hypothetical protein
MHETNERERAYRRERRCPAPGLGGFQWRDIAASAYRAYAVSTGNKNFRGEPMPEFEALPFPIQTAWEAASRHVGDCLTGGTELPDENAWAGWIPPHLRPLPLTLHEDGTFERTDEP